MRQNEEKAKKAAKAKAEISATKTSFLKPFAQYYNTTLISGEKYTTLSAIIPVIMELDLHLEELKKVQDLSDAATVLQSEVRKRYKIILTHTTLNMIHCSLLQHY